LRSDKYRSFFTYHPDAIFEHNLDGVMIDANLASETTTKFNLAHSLGTHYLKFISTEYQEIAQTAFEQALEGNSQHLEIQALNASGEHYWLDLTYLPIKQDQQVVGVLGIARDITERCENEKMLRLLKRSVDANPHGIVLTSASAGQPIKYVNPASEALTGYKKEEIIGENCRFLQGPDTDSETNHEIRNALKEQQEIKTIIKNY